MKAAFNNEKPPVSNQDAFDRACERLILHFDQPRSVPFRGDACVYREADTEGNIINCCVIGYMIPDWPEIMPGAVCNTEAIAFIMDGDYVDEWFANVQVRVLSDLQSVHDMAENWRSKETMKEILLMVASEHGLVFDERRFGQV